MKLQTTNYNLPTFPRIMLVDMNSFFASVEQQANPFLRGKPLGVCASLHETSCLIAASKEAKALGIKTGTLVYKAKKVYPKIILMQSEPEKYREVNRRIVRIFCDYTDRVEVYSIDEAFLEMPNVKCKMLNVLQIATEIKKRIRQEVGEWLTCSVGIGQNKFLAKLAADLKKPDGLSIVWRENLPEIYRSKKFSDLWGLASGWTKRLESLGFTSPSELLGYPVQNLISLFGKPGFYLWQRINGLEEDVIDRHPELDSGSRTKALDLDSGSESGMTEGPKSFGHSWVLNFRTRDKEKLKPVILRLAERAARRMRKEGSQALGVFLSATLTDGSHFAQGRKLRSSIDRGIDLYWQVSVFFESWKFNHEVLHIAVRFTNLHKRSRQLTLLVDKSHELTDTVDMINEKYGEFTVRSGLLTNTQDYAPDAIAFGR